MNAKTELTLDDFGHYFTIQGKNRYLRIWNIDDPNKGATVLANGTEDAAINDALSTYRAIWNRRANEQTEG